MWVFLELYFYMFYQFDSVCINPICLHPAHRIVCILQELVSVLYLSLFLDDYFKWNKCQLSLSLPVNRITRTHMCGSPPSIITTKYADAANNHLRKKKMIPIEKFPQNRDGEYEPQQAPNEQKPFEQDPQWSSKGNFGSAILTLPMPCWSRWAFQWSELSMLFLGHWMWSDSWECCGFRLTILSIGLIVLGSDHGAQF